MKEYVFISYKSEQKEIALRIKRIIEENGISCWMAPESILGSNYASEIYNAVGGCKAFVLVLSSISQNSSHIKKEIDIAINKDKLILPFMIEDFSFAPDIAYYLTNVQLLSAFISWDSTIEKLIREIRWAFDSIDISRNPSSIIEDPVKTGTNLPHVLENGYLLFGRYKIKKLLRTFETKQQHYLAEDLHTGKDVLVSYIDRTVPHKEITGISYSGTFFQHPYIASPIDEYSCESYFVRVEPFYYVESLNSLVCNNHPQSYPDVIKWAIAVCQAMIYLNEEMNYAYGKMNATNIRIQKNGLPILFDTSLAIPLGSKVDGFFSSYEVPPEMMTPECIAEPTIDIYSLGQCMYFALTGNHDNQKDYNKFKSANDICIKNVPKKLNMIIIKCLEFRKSKRYQSFRDLLTDLESVFVSMSDNSLVSFIKKKIFNTE